MIKLSNRNNYVKSTQEIEDIKWKGHDCIRFISGGYEAIIVPEVGANIIQLKYNPEGLDLLRTPKEDVSFEEFKDLPQIYGLPVLFPPNRIEDGTFKFENRIYKFPINEPEKNNYIHGFIKSDRWNVVRKEIVKNKVIITVKFDFTKDHRYYKYFPHEYSFKMEYKLSEYGLEQTTSITNLSDENMPICVGYHTAFNIPFKKGSSKDDYRLIASVNKKWRLNERSLPTGENCRLNSVENHYLSDGIKPLEHPVDDIYSLENLNINGKDFRGAIIENAKEKIKVFYEMGEEYKYMMLWNDMGDKGYACIEPQSCIINAPNVKLDNSVSGFKSLKPKESWKASCKIFCEVTVF